MKILYNNMFAKLEAILRPLKKMTRVIYATRWPWNELKFEFFLPDCDVFVLPNQK